MPYNYDVNIAREVCAEMGIVWDDSATEVVIGNKPINENFSIEKLFHAMPYNSEVYTKASFCIESNAEYHLVSDNNMMAA
jgi:hypothetical protein